MYITNNISYIAKKQELRDAAPERCCLTLTCEFHLRYLKIEYAFIVARVPNIMPCRCVMIYKEHYDNNYKLYLYNEMCISIQNRVIKSQIPLYILQNKRNEPSLFQLCALSWSNQSV